jgi:hypothetical protein
MKVLVILIVLVVVVVGGLAGAYFAKPDLLPKGLKETLDGFMAKEAVVEKKPTAPKQVPAVESPVEQPAAAREDAAAEEIEIIDSSTSARDAKIPGMDDALDVELPTFDMATPVPAAPVPGGTDIEGP